MYVLITGLPRSRSSFLISAYENYYKMVNLHEQYDNNSYQYEIKKKLTKQSIDLCQIEKQKIDFLKSKTETVFRHEKAVTKLFPRFFMTHTSKRQFKNLNEFNFKVIEDLSTTFQLGQFDEIVILERNLIDSVISYIFGKKTGFMLFPKNFSQFDWFREKYSKIEITEEDLKLINFYILEYLIYQDMKNFLISKYDPTILNYEDTVKFVQENFKNIDNNLYMDPKFNYREIISDYIKVEDYIKQTLLNYSKIYNKIDFR